MMLYFHVVLIRDRNRNKDEQIVNSYRLVLNSLNVQGMSKWFLEQIDYNYVREFLIEAPKMMRYLCLGLVMKAMEKIVEENYKI
jgi:hypothetical protein